MTDPSQLSDAQLLAAIRGSQPAPRPQAPRSAPQRQAPRQTGDTRPRGVRNNNPGNIEDGAFARSLPGYKGSDGRFAIFDSPEAGGVAKERLLGSYIERGFNTPAKIINRWAPPSDNNPTSDYAAYVARRAGVGLDDVVTPDRIPSIAQAIAEFENGGQVEHIGAPNDQGGREAIDSFPAQDPTKMSDADLLATIKNLGQAQDGPIEVEINHGVVEVEGKFYTVNKDGQRVELGEDWATLSPQEQSSRFAQMAEGRSEGYMKAKDARLAEREEQKRYGYDVGFTDQFTAPINDELGWLYGAGTQAIKNLGSRLTGQEVEVSAMDAGNATMDVARAEQEQFARDRPGQAITGGVLGGMAFAPVKGAQALGLLGRVGQSAGIGGAYGVAEGEGVGGRAVGGLLGGAIGGATAGAVEALPIWGRAVSRDIERLRTPAPAQPLGRGEQRVAGAVERALVRDNIEPAQMQGLLSSRPDGALPFEAGGENLVGLAEVLAQTPGQGRTGLLGAIRDRSSRTNDRITQRLSDSFGAEGNYFETLGQSIKQRGQQAAQGMEQIGDTSVALSENAQHAVGSDLARGAIREAAQNRMASADPAQRIAGQRLAALAEDPTSVQAITVRDAQEISYALREAASSAFSTGNGARGRALSDLGSAVRDSAKEGSPEYAGWLKSFGDASEHIEALQDGRKIFAKATDRNGMSASELRSRWGEWSEVAQDNFRRGVGEAILDEVRGKGGVTAMRSLLRSDEFGDRVRVAFPTDEAFDGFMAAAEQEVRMAGRANQVVGNSATDRRAAARVDLGQQAGIDPIDAIGSLADLGSPVAMGGRALKEVLKHVPRKDRSILGDEQLNVLLGEALKDETVMTRLLNNLEHERALRNRADGHVRALGLLAHPGAIGSGQERSRGLLTARP